MSEHSKIEWTDATWNVVIGCDKVSPGCDNCYAIRTATRMQANPNPKISGPYEGTAADGEWTGRVNFVDHRLDQPLRWTKPKRIFVNAQSDLFHADVTDEQIASVWAVMALAGQHTFQVLTKRPARMRSLLNSENFKDRVAVEMAGPLNPNPRGRLDLHWPRRNVHLGVSVEDQKRADLRIPQLLDTPAAVRFLSCEPLLGPVSFRWAKWAPVANANHLDGLNGIDWVIVGGESGPGARPMHPAWVRAIRDQCTEAPGVAFHFKQWGEFLLDDEYELAPGESSLAKLIDGDYWVRVGRRRAGRELDGRTWDEQPAATR